MSSAVRVLHFARVPGTPAPGPRGQVMVSRVLLDEDAAPVGTIVHQFHAWHYLLADGAPSGLVSTQSRPDLEQQIARFYFGPEPVGENTAPDLPLAL
jgi:hypothetical protein